MSRATRERPRLMAVTVKGCRHAMSTRRHLDEARTGRTGRAVLLAPIDTSSEAAIGSLIERRHDSCWIWTGPTNKGGYGVHPKARLVHRFVWETLRGPIPDGMVVHHLCETPPCCNPQHLELMTLSDHSSHHARKQHAVTP